MYGKGPVLFTGHCPARISRSVWFTAEAMVLIRLFLLGWRGFDPDQSGGACQDYRNGMTYDTAHGSGATAPTTGDYQLLNIFGFALAYVVLVRQGEILPEVPRGCSWGLVVEIVAGERSVGGLASHGCPGLPGR